MYANPDGAPAGRKPETAPVPVITAMPGEEVVSDHTPPPVASVK